MLQEYLHRIGPSSHQSPLCPLCKLHEHSTKYLFRCPIIQTFHPPRDLWSNPAAVADLWLFLIFFYRFQTNVGMAAGTSFQFFPGGRGHILTDFLGEGGKIWKEIQLFEQKHQKVTIFKIQGGSNAPPSNDVPAWQSSSIIYIMIQYWLSQ